MKVNKKVIWKVLKIIGGIIWVAYTAASTIVNYELANDWYKEKSENRLGKYILWEIEAWLRDDKLDNYATVCRCKDSIAEYHESIDED